MRTGGILAIALAVIGTAAPVSGQQRQGTGAGETQHPLFGTMRDQRDTKAKRCEDSRRSLKRVLLELEQKHRRDHEMWHRRNDRLSGGEYLRKHQSFHQQLQREREQAERVHLKDCDEVRRTGGGDRDDDKSRNEHDALERERDRFRGKIGRGQDH